ncbi:hypothetical protein PILCRDRAFT_823523 [Piloderma croceum F 1598]|uniref:Uncharacterized protein n=1 Tax=Piloderma croceum (strain F 1598) TaxID=765440 RepID=A0A0C3AZ33_PILCF|nr:hypothetical protein PILCRDRAFT_823523 [Piloderma croceum F 1598]
MYCGGRGIRVIAGLGSQQCGNQMQYQIHSTSEDMNGLPRSLPCASDVKALEVVLSSRQPSPFRSQPGVRLLPDDDSGRTVSDGYNDVVSIPCGGTRVNELHTNRIDAYASGITCFALVGSERDIFFRFRLTIAACCFVRRECSKRAMRKTLASPQGISVIRSADQCKG